MHRFIRGENVQRYIHLLDRVTDEPDRHRILQLLAEERQKQQDALTPLEFHRIAPKSETTSRSRSYRVDPQR